MPEATPTVNELVRAVSDATMQFTLATSALPADATASHLRDAVAVLEDAITRLRREVIIRPDAPIDVETRSGSAAVDSEIAQLAEMGIPAGTKVDLSVALGPEVDGRSDAAHALFQLNGREAVFVWNPTSKTGAVDLTQAAQQVLDVVDPSGDSSSDDAWLNAGPS